MIIPSMTPWGSPSITEWSMNAPGSPSSPLQMTYLGSPGAFLHERHLRPASKPPPPRPRSLARSTIASTSSGVMVPSALASDW